VQLRPSATLSHSLHWIDCWSPSVGPAFRTTRAPHVGSQNVIITVLRISSIIYRPTLGAKKYSITDRSLLTLLLLLMGPTLGAKKYFYNRSSVIILQANIQVTTSRPTYNQSKQANVSVGITVLVLHIFLSCLFNDIFSIKTIQRR
jgi:hypothetical protein